MKLLGAALLLACAAAIPTRARADEDAAKQKLTAAIVDFGKGDLKGARAALDEAERLGSEAKLLGRIHRQRAILADAEGRRTAVVVSLMRALYFDPTVTLSTREHHGEIVRLYECAKRLYDEGVNEATVEARYGAELAKPAWTCPLGAASTAPPVGAAPPPAPPPEKTAPEKTPPEKIAPPAPDLTPPTPPQEEERRGLLASPMFWIVVGVVAAGGGAAAIALAVSGKEAAYGGNTGVVIGLSRP